VAPEITRHNSRGGVNGILKSEFLSLVNVSSVNGTRPAAFQGVYSITKGALVTMTRAFAKELALRQIRVTALLPGFTDTRFSPVQLDSTE